MEKETSKAMNVRDASVRIMDMKSTDEVLDFVAGDDRITVLRVADQKLEELGHEGILGEDEKLKEAFQDMWEKAAPASEGQGGEPDKPKQGETGEVTQKTDEFKEGMQGTKAAEPTEKGYVTCEDVIEKMRAEGKKI